MSVTQPFPNPDTYLNHLAPDDAAQLEVVRIIHATFLGAVLWDILAFIPQDVKVLRQGGGVLTTICYLSTRITAAVCMTLWVVLEARPISHCEGILAGINAACILTIATASYLFLKRVQAVYVESRLVQWGFALIFICANSTNILPIFSISMAHVPGTGYCTVSRVEVYGTTGYFMGLIFDGLVFVSISYKIAYLDQGNIDTRANWVSRFFTGKTLPRLSKSILHGGQKYYLFALSGQITALVVTFAPSVPPRFRIAPMTPAVIVTAVMVCRVHREMVLAFRNLDGDVARFQSRVLTSVHFVNAQQTPGEAASTVVVRNFSETPDFSSIKGTETRPKGTPFDSAV